IGPSAHSFRGGRRLYFEGDLEAFISASDIWQLAVDDGEGGSDEEKLMLGLRIAEGIDLDRLDADFKAAVIKSAAPLLKAKLLKLDGSILKITDDGFIVSNSIIASLI
ncbi:MAG: coproporphyrinogen III oxidase family protein, partial [Oscillospiraceae bacterium]|nr:coproporphyrinogen III oxidase family protein [Oscillospiraceae bacterium]